MCARTLFEDLQKLPYVVWVFCCSSTFVGFPPNHRIGAAAHQHMPHYPQQMQCYLRASMYLKRESCTSRLD